MTEQQPNQVHDDEGTAGQDPYPFVDEENLVCADCTAEFVVGWIEEYGSDECPDCGSCIVTKADKKAGRRR
jgi:DNA-directed RNA polymerase subunit RPC12/RpoP